MKKKRIYLKIAKRLGAYNKWAHCALGSRLRPRSNRYAEENLTRFAMAMAAVMIEICYVCPCS